MDYVTGGSASTTKSYHNGGVEGDSFANWYDQNLASHFDVNSDDQPKGSGSGGTKGSGSGGTKGSGSGGTKGSGSGGTKGSGSGGTKGSGSGGTKGSGSGGTKGSGSGGTKGCDNPDDGGPEVGKVSYTYEMGEPGEINVDVTMTPEGTLFFVVRQSNFEDEPADIDGIMFDVADDSTLTELAVYPDENNTAQGDVTDVQVDASGVTELSNGAGDGNAYDVGLQFGSVPDSVEGQITQTNFTLRSDDGRPLTFDDIDLNNMKVIVNSEFEDGAVLGVNNSDNPSWTESDAAPDGAFTTEDIMGLMTQEVDEDAMPVCEDYMDMVEDEPVFI